MHPGGPAPELRRGVDRDASSRDEQPRLESKGAFHRSLRLGRGAASEHVPAGPPVSLRRGPGICISARPPVSPVSWQVAFGIRSRQRADISNVSEGVAHLDLGGSPAAQYGVGLEVVVCFYHESMLIDWDSALRKSLPFINMCVYLNAS